MSNAVTPFRGSATERTLRGALAELPAERRDDVPLAIWPDDLERVLDTVEAYERGAPVGLLRQPTRALPAWMHVAGDVLTLALLAEVVLWIGRHL